MNIDFHAHVLPGADHGSADLITSQRQLELASKAQVNMLVATPHFYPQKESLKAFLSRRSKAYSTLKENMPEDSPKLVIGAEVLICKGLETLENIESLCVSGSNCILLEMPNIRWNERLLVTIAEIRDAVGLYPVIAHVDRYDSKDAERLFELGLKAQVNASSLCDFFHRKQLRQWIEQGHIVAIGSDIHGINSAYKDYVKAQKILSGWWDDIMNETQALLRQQVLL